MLYIVPTPIGNLKDITLRAIEVLKEVDVILCEDTRNSIKLLNYYNIKSKLLSYHKFNEKSMSEKIIERLKNGENFALISDAGMPGICDPGEILISKCIENNVDYTVLPGANAFINAVVSSPFKKNLFTFIGFLDRNSLKKELLKYKDFKGLSVFYESPHRLLKTLIEMKNIFGNREVFIIKEISKVYETKLYFRLDEAIMYFDENKPKGEFVIVVNEKEEKNEEINFEEILNLAKIEIKNGRKIKDISKEFSKKYNLNRQDLYKILSERR